LLFALGFHPRFELPDGFALYRHLDLRVHGIGSVARRVAHEGHPHVLDDASFHEPRVERMAKVVKADIADARAADRGFPRGFDPLDRAASVGEYQAFRLFAAKPQEQCPQLPCERNLAGVPVWRFRPGDRNQIAVEIDMFHALRKEFVPPHPGVERRNRDVLQVRRGGCESLIFFPKAHHDPRLAPWFRQPDAGDGICGEEAFVHRPIQKVAKDFDVTVECGFGELLRFVTCGTELPDRRLGDGADGPLAEMRQEHFQTVEVIGTWRAVGEEPCRQVRKGHVGRANLVPPPVQLFPELALNRFRFAAVRGSCGLEMPDAIDRATTHSTAGNRVRRGGAPGQWIAPPLRTTGRLKQPKSKALLLLCAVKSVSEPRSLAHM